MPTSVIYRKSYKQSRSVSYYRISDHSDENDLCITDRALVVNCTGIVDLPFDFTAFVRGGRKDYYLLYLTGGALHACVAGVEREFTAGDAVLIPPGNEYRYQKSSLDDVRYLWAHFSGSQAGELVKRFGMADGGVFKVGIDEKLSMLFMSMVEDFIRRDDYFEDSSAVTLTEILICMRRRLDSLAAEKSDSLGRIFNSIKYIHENFKLPITNETLAGIEHLSVSQYIALFRRCTGTTPRSYLIELRVRSSCDLLRTSDLTVAQIAEAVGYEDSHYFSRIFKTHRGISPENYRREHKEQ